MKTVSTRKMLLGLAITSLAIFLTGCGAQPQSNNSTDTTTPKIISMTSADQFSPQTITVPAGTTIQWNNADTDPHAPVADTTQWKDAGLNSDIQFPTGVAAGTSWSWIIPAGTASGTKIYYHCRFHGVAGNGTSLGTGMVGVLVVE